MSGAVPRLTVVGSTMIDLVAYTDRVPDRGETLAGDRFAQGFGGKGANQAVMARLMGAEVAMVNTLGQDGYGDQTMENFASYGIDTTHVRQVPGASGVAHIWVESDGANRIIIIPGSNNALRPEHGVAAIVEPEHIDAVIGQFEVDQAVTAAAFAAARQGGVPTILNPAPGAPISADLAAVSDWVIPNEVEFGILARAAGLPDDAEDPDAQARLATELGVRLLVTLGEGGAALVGESGDARIILAPKADAVDTTGAGDAFVGAFVFGLASGWDEVDAVRLGCAIAADSVLRPGTQSSFPDSARCGEIIAGVQAAS